VKVAVHGAGSIGCWVGGAWAAGGLDVTLIGRERVGREIAENGLILTDSEAGRIALRPDQIRFSARPKELAGADIAFASDLPRASGMSSSSALVVSIFSSGDTGSS